MSQVHPRTKEQENAWGTELRRNAHLGQLIAEVVTGTSEISRRYYGPGRRQRGRADSKKRVQQPLAWVGHWHLVSRFCFWKYRIVSISSEFH